MILPLLSEKDPFLREEPETFDFESPQVNAEDLEKQLIENMIYYRGVGLSANQIGIPVKAFALLVDDKPMVVFNPKILDFSDDSVYIREGCLSFPGLYFAVERAKGVTTYYQNKEGKEYSGNFTDLSARVFQHEMEHMGGELFIDNVSNFILNSAMKKRKLFLRKLKKQIPA